MHINNFYFIFIFIRQIVFLIFDKSLKSKAALAGGDLTTGEDWHIVGRLLAAPKTVRPLSFAHGFVHDAFCGVMPGIDQPPVIMSGSGQ